MAAAKARTRKARRISTRAGLGSADHARARRHGDGRASSRHSARFAHPRTGSAGRTGIDVCLARTADFRGDSPGDESRHMGACATASPIPPRPTRAREGSLAWKRCSLCIAYSAWGCSPILPCCWTMTWQPALRGRTEGISPQLAKAMKIASRRKAARSSSGCISSFMAIARREPERVVTVDARRPKDVVHQEVVAAVHERLLARQG